MKTMNAVDVSQSPRGANTTVFRQIVISLSVAACLHSVLLFAFQAVKRAEPSINEPMFIGVSMSSEGTCSIPGLRRPVIPQKPSLPHLSGTLSHSVIVEPSLVEIEFDEEFDTEFDLELFPNPFSPSMSFVDQTDEKEEPPQ